MTRRKNSVLIHNFPNNYPVHRKMVANIVNLIGLTTIRVHKNLLHKENYHQFRNNVRKGDIVLVGQFRRASSFFVSGPINHALIYIGKNKLIHSIRNGVQTTTFDNLFREYDTMVILRLRNADFNQINNAIEYARNCLGKPFNFDFKKDKHEKYYCSELIYRALDHAGIKFTLNNPHLYSTALKFILRRDKTLHPMCYLNHDFKIVMASSNLDITDSDNKTINLRLLNESKNRHLNQLPLRKKVYRHLLDRLLPKPL